MNARALIPGVAGGLLALLLLAPATGTALGKLADARAAHAAAARVAAAPVTPPPPLLAADARISADAALDRVRTLAAQAGVLVERGDAVRDPSGLVRLSLRLSGPDKAVIALADRVERDLPLIRLAAWELVALGDDAARLEGEALGAWR